MAGVGVVIGAVIGAVEQWVEIVMGLVGAAAELAEPKEPVVVQAVIED